MDPTLQAGMQAPANAAATSQAGTANAAQDAMTQQMVDQGTQQIFGLILNLVISQTGEG